jgi:hypothetical protein
MSNQLNTVVRLETNINTITTLNDITYDIL